jgi:hypothetical protein
MVIHLDAGAGCCFARSVQGLGGRGGELVTTPSPPAGTAGTFLAAERVRRSAAFKAVVVHRAAAAAITVSLQGLHHLLCEMPLLLLLPLSCY